MDMIDKLNIMLGALGKHIKNDAKGLDPKKGGTGIDPGVVEAWKERFTGAAEALVLAKNRLTKTGDILERNEVEEKLAGCKRRRNDDSSAAAKDCIAELKELLKSEIENFDAKSSDAYRSLLIKAGLAKDRNDDDDVEVEEAELTAADFKCPYTTLTFKKAMMNTHGGCKHRIDAAAVDVLSKTKQGPFDCPIPGCVKKWTKAGAKEDTEFMLEMQRFERTQGSQRTRANDATEIDDDDDEGEYTAL